MKELCRMDQEYRVMDHLHDSLHGKDLSLVAHKAQDRLHQDKGNRLLKKYNFEPDPVEKMNLNLSLLKQGLSASSGGSVGEDIGKVLTAKDLTLYRIRMQKLTSEQRVAERRKRRRAFLDKAIIGSVRPKGRAAGNNRNWRSPIWIKNDLTPIKAASTSRSFSLPALNGLSQKRTEHVKPGSLQPPRRSQSKYSISSNHFPAVHNTKRPLPPVVTSSKTSAPRLKLHLPKV